MVQRPFSENTGPDSIWKNLTNIHSVRVNEALLFPNVAQMKTVFHNIQRPKISTILTSLETSKGKASYSKTKISNPSTSNELRLTRNTFTDINVTTEPPKERTEVYSNFTNARNVKLAIKNYYQIPTPSRFFPPVEDHDMHASTEQRGTSSKENTVIIPKFHEKKNEKEEIQVKGILIPNSNKIKTQTESTASSAVRRQTMHSIIDIDPENEKADFLIEGLPMDSTLFTYNLTSDPYSCSILKTTNTDIDAQEKFSQLNIEVSSQYIRNTYYYDHRIEKKRYDELWRV